MNSLSPPLWRLVRAHGYAILVIGSFLGLLPWLVIRAVDGQWTSPASAGPSASIAIGALFAVIGGGLSYACMVLFVIRGKGTALPTDPPRVFVATGPYRWVRNSMYLGNASFALGIGLMVSSLVYVLYTLGLIAVTHCYIVGVEEPLLRLRFGHTYEAYCRPPFRWLPRRPSSESCHDHL